MKQLFALLCTLAFLGASGIFVWQQQGYLTNKNDSVALRCNQGQTQAVVEVPATTGPTTAPTTYPTSGPTTVPTTYPTTAPFGGQVTVSTATTRGNFPGPFGSPAAVAGALGATPGPAPSSFPAKLYVALNGDQWIEAVFSSPNPGGVPNLITLTCIK